MKNADLGIKISVLLWRRVRDSIFAPRRAFGPAALRAYRAFNYACQFEALTLSLDQNRHAAGDITDKVP